MSFPEGMTLVPVTGTIANAPAVSVRFIGRYALVGAEADAIVPPFEVPVVVAEDGTFTVQLPANDDPDWDPIEWQYVVRIDNGSGKPIIGALTVPLADAVAGFDLADRIVIEQPVPPVSGGGGDGGPVSWSDITGKPTTFTPAAHTQAISTITGLQAALDAAAAAPSWSTLSGKPSTFPPEAHSQAISTITGLQDALDAKATQEDVTELGEAVAALEAVGPVVRSWNGSAYVADADAIIYVGPSDPGAVADGSVWIDTSA